MINWTLCGYCCERVPCEDSGVVKPHNCEVLKDMKRKVDLALSEIQKDYNHIYDLIVQKYDERTQALLKRIENLEKQLSTCIDVKLLYSDRQARETWQAGCDVMIETLHKRVIDMDFMLKNSLLCVDNSHANDAAKYYGLAPIAQLNQIAKEVPHHPSRKHLENKLREKNLRIKELEDQLCMRNHECQAALNESNKMRERVMELSKQLQDANLQIHILKNPFNGGCKL